MLHLYKKASFRNQPILLRLRRIIINKVQLVKVAAPSPNFSSTRSYSVINSMPCSPLASISLALLKAIIQSFSAILPYFVCCSIILFIFAQK